MFKQQKRACARISTVVGSPSSSPASRFEQQDQKKFAPKSLTTLPQSRNCRGLRIDLHSRFRRCGCASRARGFGAITKPDLLPAPASHLPNAYLLGAGQVYREPVTLMEWAQLGRIAQGVYCTEIRSEVSKYLLDMVGCYAHSRLRRQR